MGAREAPRWGGNVQMTEERYWMVARLIGPFLEEPCCEPIPISRKSGYEQPALYVVVNRAGYICYGGRTDALGPRFGKHRQQEDKVEEWAEYWVFPLYSDTHPDKIKELEAEMNSRLGIQLVKRPRRLKRPRRR